MGAMERPPVALRLVAMVAQTAARMSRDSMLAESPRCIVSSASPFPSRISVTGARTAGRAATYRTTNPTESGPDCCAAPGIPRNRPDHGAAGRTSSGTPDGAGGNGLAGGRVITLIRRILGPGNHRDIKERQSCGRKEKEVGSWHFEAPRVTRRGWFEVSPDGLRGPASGGEQPPRGCQVLFGPASRTMASAADPNTRLCGSGICARRHYCCGPIWRQRLHPLRDEARAPCAVP